MQFILVQKKSTTRRVALAAALTGGVALGALAAGGPAEAQQTPTGQQVTPQQTRAQAARARQAQRGQQPAAAPAGAVQLDTIDVQGDQIRRPALLGAPPPVFAGGQVASGARIGALGNQPLMSTPFAVQAITAQVAQEQQLQQLPDLAKYDSSVSQNVGRYTYFDTANIRGFQQTPRIEGVPTARGIIQQTEPFERFEILRGPAATALGSIIGFGVGSINLIPKRAGDVPVTEITARYLGGAAFGAHLDVGRRFGPNKEWGVRFNGAFNEGESAISNTRLSRKFGHLALDYRGERLRVTFDLNASDNFPRGVSPGLFIPGGFAVPRPPRLDRSFGPSWTGYRAERLYGILRAEYDLTPDWTIGAVASLGGGREAGRYDGDATLRNANGDISQFTAISDGRSYNNFVGQGYLRGKLVTGPVTHRPTVFFTSDIERFNFHRFRGYTCQYNLYQPVVCPDPGRERAARGVSFSENRRTGIIVANEMSILDERILLTVGARYTELHQFFARKNSAVPPFRFDGDALTPIAGLVIKPTNWLSLFANYVETLEFGEVAPANAVNANQPSAPFKSRQFEVGAKVEFGRFGATLAYFDIERNSAFLRGDGVFSADGRQNHRGVELFGYGEVVDGVKFFGGVTFMEPILRRTRNGAFDGNVAPGVSKLRVVGTLDVDFGKAFGWAPGFSMYGTIAHTGPAFLDSANLQKAAGYTTFDLGAAYKTKISGNDVTFRVAVENLTDQRYWAVGRTGGTIYAGNPRTIVASTTFRF